MRTGEARICEKRHGERESTVVMPAGAWRRVLRPRRTDTVLRNLNDGDRKRRKQLRYLGRALARSAVVGGKSFAICARFHAADNMRRLATRR